MCVNSKEAARLLGASLSPKEAAIALVRRATVPGAVRVVTGGGQAATAAAFEDGAQTGCHEAMPGAVLPSEIKRLLGVGDAFAAMFLSGACFDAEGAARTRLNTAEALDAAQAYAGRFLTGQEAP
jgi:sugar/nucleoside kinase (ribokinase family)